MKAKSELTQALLEQSEQETYHIDFKREMNFYAAVKAGDTALVHALFMPIPAKGMGVLSDDPMRNLRYHLIISTSLITRACLEGGLPTETAYTLSDLYIRKADKLFTVDSLSALHQEMVLDFTTRMHNMHNHACSKVVRQALDYISSHLESPLREAEIAAALHVSSSYLSTLFRRETGHTLTSHIQKMRVEAAKDMLRFSDRAYTDISDLLCFNSHSHFIQVFKKYTGTTPKEYRLHSVAQRHPA